VRHRARPSCRGLPQREGRSRRAQIHRRVMPEHCVLRARTSSTARSSHRTFRRSKNRITHDGSRSTWGGGAIQAQDGAWPTTCIWKLQDTGASSSWERVGPSSRNSGSHPGMGHTSTAGRECDFSYGTRARAGDNSGLAEAQPSRISRLLNSMKFRTLACCRWILDGDVPGDAPLRQQSDDDRSQRR